jgi:putative addiction module component (TIGR02574 family)
MPATLESIQAQALNLPPDDRAVLAENLISSLCEKSSATELHPDWTAELERRVAQVASGEVSLIDGGLVMARARALVTRR